MTESNIPGLSAASATPTATGSVAAPEHEIVYYEGRPLLRADQAKAAFWVFVGVILIATPFVVQFALKKEFPGWAWAICIILGILAFVLPWMIMRTTRYRITSYRIDFERGLFTKKIDTLELWHVEDIKFEQGLLDRMMNVGSITVMSNDRTNPKLELHGIPDPRKIFDALKERVIAVKRQRGVIKMDMGT
jgi:membrane protein YdbS with pleckstrin-like domain